MLLDGQALEEEYFATKVVDSLGSFSMTNQFLVDNLKEKLKQENQMISRLQNKIRTTEKNVRDKFNKGFEQDRDSDKQEIQLLKSSLDEMHKNVQASENQAIHQSELVKKVHSKLNLTESMVIDITVFQA